MSDLRDLYQDVLLDHYRRPRNSGVPEAADHTAAGHNPLCGDVVRLGVQIAEGRLAAIGFEGAGCAISVASASLMTEAVQGKTEQEAEALFRGFQEMVTSDSAVPPPAELGKLAIFAGVREFPARVKCATLPWHTLHAALQKTSAPVSTE
jgi:nitrogen fixation protein NifU and related proteins